MSQPVFIENILQNQAQGAVGRPSVDNKKIFVIRKERGQNVLRELSRSELTLVERVKVFFGRGGAAFKNVADYIVSAPQTLTQCGHLDRLQEVCEKYNRGRIAWKRADSTSLRVIQYLISKQLQLHTAPRGLVFETTNDIQNFIRKIHNESHSDTALIQDICNKIPPQLFAQFFQTILHLPKDVSILLFLQKHRIQWGDRSVFQHIFFSNAPLQRSEGISELKRRFLAITSANQQIVDEFHICEEIGSDSKWIIDQDTKWELLQELLNAKVRVRQQNRLCLLDKNDALLRRYNEVLGFFSGPHFHLVGSVNDSVLLQIAGILEQHLPADGTRIDLQSLFSYAQFLHHSEMGVIIFVEFLRNWLLGKPESPITRKLQTIIQTFDKLNDLRAKTRQLAGDVTEKLTAWDALEQAFVIEYDLPDLMKKMTQKVGSIIFNGLPGASLQGAPNRRRLFWRKRDVKNLTEEIFVVTPHEIGRGGKNVVSTAIRVNANFQKRLCEVKDLVAYQESIEANQETLAFETEKNLLEQIGSSTKILPPYFTHIFQPELVSKQYKLGVFSELCEVNFTNLVQYDFLSLVQQPFSKQHFEYLIQRLIIFFDAVDGLASLHSKNIFYGDLKPGNVLIRQQNKGLPPDSPLLRGVLSDWDTAVDYKKVDKEVVGSYFLWTQHRREEKRRGLESATFGISCLTNRHYPSRLFTPPDIYDSYGGNREQAYKSDMWASGMTLWQIIHGKYPDWFAQWNSGVQPPPHMEHPIAPDPSDYSYGWLYRQACARYYQAVQAWNLGVRRHQFCQHGAATVEDFYREADKLRDNIHIEIAGFEQITASNPFQYCMYEALKLVHELLEPREYAKRPTAETCLRKLTSILQSSLHKARDQNILLSDKFTVFLQEIDARAPRA